MAHAKWYTQGTAGSFLQFVFFLRFFACCWEIPESGERSFSLFFLFCWFSFSLSLVRAVKCVPLSADYLSLKFRDFSLKFGEFSLNIGDFSL